MPTPRSVHQRTPLDRVAIAYAPQNFIAGLCLPKVMVLKLRDSYYVFGKEYRKVERVKYEPRGLPQEVTYAVSTTNFDCENYGLRHLILEDEYKNADNAMDPEQDSAELLSQKVKLSREKRVASLLFTAGNYPTGNKATLSGTDQFSHASSTPIKTIKDACNDVVARGGVRPNVAVMNMDVFLALEEHTTVVGRLQYTDPLFRKEKVAALLGLQKIFIGEAIEDTADDGQTESISNIWTDSVALYYVPPQILTATGDEAPAMLIGKKVPTFACQFTYFDFQVDVVPAAERPGKNNWLWVRQAADEVITGSSFGYLLSDCLA